MSGRGRNRRRESGFGARKQRSHDKAVQQPRHLALIRRSARERPGSTTVAKMRSDIFAAPKVPAHPTAETGRRIRSVRENAASASDLRCVPHAVRTFQAA
jgi:hypothetical protein